MSELVDQDGRVVRLDDPAEAQAAVASGQLGLRADKEANLVNADGKVVVFDDTSAAAELLADPSSGYRLASNDEVAADIERAEFSDIGSKAAALGEGALAGGTLGGYDLAVQGGLLGDNFAADSRARAEHSSGYRTAGEIGGIIASSLATGGAGGAASGALKGASMAGKAARLASAPARGALALGRGAEGLAARALGQGGKSLLGKVTAKGAQMGVGGAVEGALFGAGQEVSRASLDRTIFENPDLAAERIAMGAKNGALMGGAFGGGLGAGGAAVTHGAGKVAAFAKKAFNAESVETFIQGQAGQRSVKAAMGGRNAKALRKLTKRAPGGTKLRPVEEQGQWMLDKGIVTATSTGDDIAGAAARVRRESGEAMEALVKRADEASAGSGINASALADDIMSKVDNFASNPVFKTEGKRLMKDLEPILEHLRTGEVSKIGLRVEDASMSFDDLWTLRRNMDEKASRASKMGNDLNPFQDQIEEVRGVIEDAFSKAGDDALAGTGDDFAKQWQGSKEDYARSVWADETAQNAVERDLNNRFFSASDYGMGSSLGMGTALAGGSGGASLAVGMVSGMVHNVMRERGSAFLAGTLDALGRARSGAGAAQAKAGQLAVRNAADGVLGRVVGGAKRVSKASREGGTYLGVRFKSDRDAAAYQELSRRVSEMSAPDSEHRQAGKQTGAASVQASMGASLDALAARQADYLSGKVRPTHNQVGDGTFSHTRPPRVSPADVKALKQAVERVENPQTVLDKAAAGKLRRDDVEALKAVYPAVYEDLRQTVMDGLSEAETLPAYQERVQLGLLLDLPTDPTLEPGFVARTQQGAQEANAQQDQGGKMAPAVTPGNAKAPSKTAEMYGTRTERLAGG